MRPAACRHHRPRRGAQPGTGATGPVHRGRTWTEPGCRRSAGRV